MSLISLEPNVKVEDLSSQTLLIYGVPKCGKSTFCSNMDDVIYFATEPGTKHLELKYKPVLINSWKKFLDACGELAKMIEKDSPFKTIVIDTVDELDKFAAEHILEREGIAQLGDIPYGGGYAMVLKELMRVLKKLESTGLGLVLVSHAKEIEEEEKIGIKLKKWQKKTISVSGSRAKAIMAMSDIILYITSKVDEEGRQTGLVYTKPSMYHDAGDRSGKLPEQIEYDPSSKTDLYTKIKTYFK